ncbi:unnamed protein product [Rotaria sordida]|uniref:Uncharacterized protein n=1 Tax=Rotaria sordida TaxID=392033 RepID=A0A819MB20_9BILA|nr:unnamed protein product [Rotaria sordida]
MGESQDNETSSNNTDDDDNDADGMENINELLQRFMNEISSEANEQTVESSVIFEELLTLAIDLDGTIPFIQDDSITSQLLQIIIETAKAIRNLASNYNEKVVEHYAPCSMKSVEKAANGILDNLYEIRDSKTNDITDQQLVSATGDDKPMIMTSYAHANDQFCDKILAEIEEKRSLSDLD